MNMYQSVTGTLFGGSNKRPAKNKKTTSVLLLEDHSACMPHPGQLIHHALIQPDR